FEKTLDFIGDFSPMLGEQTLAPRSLTKTLSYDGQAIAFQLTAQGKSDLKHPALDSTLYSAHKLDPAAHQAIVERIRFFLGLDDDLRAFYDLARTDEKFAPVLNRFYGLHHVKFPSPFENAVW